MNRTAFTTPFGTIEVGEGLPTCLIAEIGLNHNGSVELAKKLIYEAAISGATFVKFQKRSPADLAIASFLDAPFEKCPALGRTQREVRNRLELSLENYRDLRVYAESLGLIFCASAFDIPSLEFLLQAEVPVIKVASHSITNGPLLERIASTGLPTICSFGGTVEAERDKAYAILKSNPLVILHCVSSYPTTDQLINLDTISFLRQRYGVPVGFSSHEEGIEFSVAASLLGAAMIERHLTLSRSMVGLDHSISLLPEEFSTMAERIKRLQKGRGINYGLREEEKAAKYNYHVAVCAVRAIAKGTLITREMLVCKQPLSDPALFFTGFEVESVIGKIASVDIPADTAIARVEIA